MPLTQRYYEEGERVEVNLGYGWTPAKVVSVRSRRRFGGPWIYGVRLEDGKYEEFKTGRGIRKLSAKARPPAEAAPVVKTTQRAAKAAPPIPQPPPAQPAVKAPAPVPQRAPAASPPERRKVGRPSEDLEMISARIHREDLGRVAELAKKLRLTRAVVIREALRRGLLVIDRDGLQPVDDLAGSLKQAVTSHG